VRGLLERRKLPLRFFICFASALATSRVRIAFQSRRPSRFTPPLVPADDGDVSWILITFTILAGWAVLRIFGGERQRQLQELQAAILQKAAQNAAAAGAQNHSAR
jgi:hypothetical protein